VKIKGRKGREGKEGEKTGAPVLLRGGKKGREKSDRGQTTDPSYYHLPTRERGTGVKGEEGGEKKKGGFSAILL